LRRRSEEAPRSAEPRARRRRHHGPSPLRGLKNLKSLNLSRNDELVDLSPLSDLTALETLELDGTAVVSVGPIAGLASLTDLQADKTPLGKGDVPKTAESCPTDADSKGVREFCGD
jgi:Leucine-rich repeat (LRR) protein